MEICQKLAGFTMAHADNVRRYMSKKKVEKLEHERDNFVLGCEQSGINASISNKLFDQMMDFAKYAFNKSHAACYADIAYITAYLKTYYPSEFFCAVASNSQLKKYPVIMQDIKKYKKRGELKADNNGKPIKLFAPNINISQDKLSISEDGDLYLGFSSIKGVSSTSLEIINERQKGQFKSLDDFFVRLPKIKSNVLEALIASGCFDDFHSNRLSIKNTASLKTAYLKTYNAKNEELQTLRQIKQAIEQQDNNSLKNLCPNGKIPTLKSVETRIASRLSAKEDAWNHFINEAFYPVEESVIKRLNAEHDYLQLYVSGHPLDCYDSNGTTDNIFEPISNKKWLGTVVSAEVMVSKKTSQPFQVLDIETKNGHISAINFNEDLISVITVGNTYVFTGKTIERDETIQLNIWNVEEAKSKKENLFFHDLTLFNIPVFKNLFKEYIGASYPYEIVFADNTGSDMIRSTGIFVNKDFKDLVGFHQLRFSHELNS